MQENSLSKICLLYVEDDKTIRDELFEILVDEFLEVVTAVDGKDGLLKYKQHNPDIILTDIRMPIMDGIEMSKIIRKDNPNIPIILSSAFSDSEYFLEAIHMGISDYILKPIDLGKLFKTLEKVSDSIVLKKEFEEKEQLLAQYKDVVDASSIVSKTNKKGHITYVNDSFVKISGYTKEELIGQNHNLVRHPDMTEATFKDLWQTLLNKKRWQGIVKNLAKDGSVYIVDSTIIPILDTDDNIVEFISIRTDITQTELQKENLKHNLDTSSKFIDEFENAITKHTLFCRTSVDAVISMTSEKFDEVLGYKEGELEDTKYVNLVKRQKNYKVHEKYLERTMKNAKVFKGLVTHLSKDNRVVYLDSSYIPIVGLDGKVLEVFCFFVDMTQSIKLNDEILATQREVISTMGAIGETRSKETGSHVRRVAEYSKLLALKIGLSEEEAEELKMASPMHDIGKVAIPDSILNKPAKLTKEEFEIMKTHAQLGYEMLGHSHQKLLRSAAIVASQHHERWDGNGYPYKLSGEDIHIYGRITAIVDVFDALGHDRVYKKAWKMEDILELFKNERGKQFDPTLVDLFMNNLDEFLAIKRRFDGEGI